MQLAAQSLTVHEGAETQLLQGWLVRRAAETVTERAVGLAQRAEQIQMQLGLLVRWAVQMLMEHAAGLAPRATL